MRFPNGGRLCLDLDDLPILDGCAELFLDFETTSANMKVPSLNVWHSCYIAGICVTADDFEESWYVPIGHNTGGNLPWEPVYAWLTRLVNSCKTWINHNVKYDMHVFSNNTGHPVLCDVVDTLTQAKLVDSDRMHYALDHLSLDWLGEDISHHAQAMKPYTDKNKDYGWIPADIMGYYGCDDVLTTRKLHRYITKKLPEQCQWISKLENKVTTRIYATERSGMNIDQEEVAVTQYKTIQRLVEIDQALDDKLGYPIKPGSNPDCFDVLCNRYGLPVIAWTDDKPGQPGSPSFDKHALKAYKQYPNAPIDVLDLILEARRLGTLNGVFLETYRNLNVNSVLHPSYKQTIRTGRLSCAMPNMQQLMPEAKQLIRPRKGHVLVSCDYSQIEFRLIVHYLRDPDAIAAYHADPDTDYHVWVAELCSITRKPAKTVNFLMGYGGGKARLLQSLATDPDLIASIHAETPKEFERLATYRAEEIYNTYHAKLPALRIRTREAETICRTRGYVKNLYGRHRHLPVTHARKAFNSLNQSSAADLMKERWVAIAEAGYEVIGSVHDELVLTMPQEQYCEAERCKIAAILESPIADIRVPIRVGVGASADNWLEASKDSKPVFWR